MRFSDDSPGDGSGGALVQEVRLLIDGRPRPDITPAVIRHPARTGTQVGRHLSTGFQPTFDYNEFIRAPSYYRDLEIPLYADLLYRLSHEDSDFLFRLQNEDTRWRDKNPDFIEKNTHLEGLLSTFVLESPEDILSADGEEVLVFIYDLSAEPDIESVQIEAVVGNDYRVEMASIYEEVEAPATWTASIAARPTRRSCGPGATCATSPTWRPCVSTSAPTPGSSPTAPTCISGCRVSRSPASTRAPPASPASPLEQAALRPSTAARDSPIRALPVSSTAPVGSAADARASNCFP